MVQLNFDATNIEPARQPDPLETAWYPATLVSTEQKPTKAGDGGYLQTEFRLDNGRKITVRFNLWNKSEQAVSIAHQELSAVCHAVGKLRVGQAHELHNSRLELYIVKEPRKDQPGLFGNDVAGFRAIGAGGPVGHTGAVGTQVTAAPTWATPAPVSPVPAQPTWAPPPAAAAPAQPQYAPPPQPQPAPVTPAGASSVPPWAR